MRSAILLLAALLPLAPAALAQGAVQEHTIFLHENPLHILPETINARVGDTLRFTVENPPAEGKTPHNLVVCADAPKPSEQCDEPWARSGMIAPGASAPLSFEITRAGTFEYWCYVAGHKGGGMVGTLVVQGEPEQKGAPGLPPAGALAAIALGAILIVRRRRA